jgi:hypothetical protein
MDLTGKYNLRIPKIITSTTTTTELRQSLQPLTLENKSIQKTITSCKEFLSTQKQVPPHRNFNSASQPHMLFQTPKQST